MIDTNRIRKDFPILKREVNGNPLIYFDNAATSQKPLQVINAVKNFYESFNANVHRSVHTLSQEATELYELARERATRFVNSRGVEEIVFVRGTTEAINLVAYSWGLRNLKQEDEVLVTLMEHHSNMVPWEMISEIKGFKVRYVDVNDDGTLNMEALEKTISKKTRLVCVTHISNVTGVVNDVERIAKLAHENGALILVDGAQSVPHMPVDVRKLDVDFLAFSGHKMLGPTGIGVLYARREILREMEPFHGGGEMISEVVFDQSRGRCSISWNTLPWKFEAGTPNVAGAVGLAAAIEYLKNLGMNNVSEHEKHLTEYTVKRLQECSSISIYGPRDASIRSGIVAFNIKGYEPHDAALILDSYGIMVRSGLHCAQPLHQRLKISSSVRASFYIYNTKEEIDRFIETLKELEHSCS